MFNALRRRPLLSAALSVVLGGLAAMQSAQAGCSVQPGANSPAQQAPAPTGGARFIDTVFHPGRFAAADFRFVNDGGPPSIVGLWKFQLISDGTSPNGPPAGVAIDFGLQQWHDDGTEEMISGGRRPGVNDVCMGVWERTGAWTYHLNHYAVGWETNPPMTGPIDSATYAGPTHIVIDVLVGAGGRSFSGHFKLTAYSATTSDPFDEHNQVAYIQGTVQATRVTADGR